MMKIGIIGCGNIAPAYIYGCSKFPEDIQVTACTDLIPEKAEAFAQKHGLQAQSIGNLLNNDDIDIVINLTIPAVHAEVSLQIIAAGKHAYGEKPLALNREDGQRTLQAANENGVRVGCAPDTFLGAGGQTCRQVIDSGLIGTPVSAVAFMACHGHESWHPNPAFYYQPGGGPLFDMGPYYLSALVNLMGPIESVSAMTSRALTERIAQHDTIRGTTIPVEVDTHVAGLLKFESGAIVNVIMSFDMWQHNLPRIEIYGTLGTLSVPDPNTFAGNVRVWSPENGEWQDVPLSGPTDLQRGIGVADMARAIRLGQPHRANGNLAYHVLDTMVAFGDAATDGKDISVNSRVERPAPFNP